MFTNLFLWCKTKFGVSDGQVLLLLVKTKTSGQRNWHERQHLDHTINGIAITQVERILPATHTHIECNKDYFLKYILKKYF
jgi:hypothetical protein